MDNIKIENAKDLGKEFAQKINDYEKSQSKEFEELAKQLEAYNFSGEDLQEILINEISDYIINMCYRPLYNSVTNETMQLKLFEVPESITFLDKLPLTEADKVDYKLLEKMALEECEEYKVKRRENSQFSLLCIEKQEKFLYTYYRCR